MKKARTLFIALGETSVLLLFLSLGGCSNLLTNGLGFGSDRPDSDVFVRDFSPAPIVKGIEEIIELPYDTENLVKAESCKIIEKNHVKVITKCFCEEDGTCKVGIKESPNGYTGPADFSYVVTIPAADGNGPPTTSRPGKANIVFVANDNAAVAFDLSPSNFSEDVEKILTLVYSDSDGDIASDCSVSSLSNVFESTSCSCDSAGVCSVGITGDLNYFGTASFGYTVTTNGNESSTAEAAFLVLPVDDAPITTDFSPSNLNKNMESTLLLNYIDIEGNLATTCSVSSLNNVTESTACSCDGAGVCSVGITGDFNYFGSASFDYTVVANGLTSNSSTSSLTIVDSSTAPVANNISPAAFNEDSESVLTLSYSDPQGDPATACSVSALTNVTESTACTCAGGTCTVGVTGTSHYNGAASFSYSVTANSETSNSASATLTINAVGDAPITADFSPASFNEDVQSLITLSYSDPDGAGDASSCAISSLSNITETQACACAAGTCTVGVTGTGHYNGSASFDFTVTDATGVSNSSTASLTIDSVGDAPVTADFSPASFNEDVQSVITLSYSDPDGAGDASSCAVSSLSNITETQACGCSSGTCTVGVTGTDDYNGSASFDFTVTDGTGVSNSSTASLTIDNVDDAPVASNITPANFNEDVESVITLSYVDDDSDLAATCAVSSLTNVTESTACACAVGTCTVGVQGTSHYNGSASFTYTVTANSVVSNSATATLTIDPVDDAPVASNITPANMSVDTQSVITLSYTDQESDDATSCSVSSLTNVTETQACACSSGTCTVGVTGTASYSGSASFAYTVSNSQTSNSATATLNIVGGDSAPVASNISPSNIVDAEETFIDLSYTDADSDLATSCSVSSLSNVTESTACSCNLGACTVGVTSVSTGAASFDYTVTANSAVSSTASASFTVDVARPSVTLVDTQTAQNDADRTTLVITKPTGVAANDVMIAVITARGTGETTLAGWTLIRNDALADIQQDMFYKVATGSEPASYTFSLGATEKASGIIVAYRNADTSSPIVADNGQTTSSSTTITAPSITVPSSELGAKLLGIYGHANSAAITMNGDLTEFTDGTNATGANGAASRTRTSAGDMTVSVAGATGAKASTGGASVDNIGQLAAIRRAQLPSDYAPIAYDITPAAFNEETESVITLSYFDPNADQATSCSITDLGDVTVSTGCSCISGTCTVGITGDSNVFGSASFNYTVTANAVTSNIATASLTINNTPDDPIANNFSPASFDEDAEAIITLDYNDPDTDLGTACSVSSLSNITESTACSCDGGGVCTVGVTGTNNYNGGASFNFTVTANGDVSNSATATLTIDSVDDAPVTENFTASEFLMDTEEVITLAYTDADSDLATSCSVSSLNNVTESTPCACSVGTCTVGVTGTASYTGPASFDFTVTANSAASNASTATLSIVSTLTMPVADNISPAAFNEDAQSIITLSYSDPNSDLATACTLSNLTNITETQACSCDGGGTCNVGVTGTNEYSGAASFKYTVTANGDTSNIANASLSINYVDDAPVASNITPADMIEDEETVHTLVYSDAESHLASTCAVSSLTNVTESTPCSCDGSGVCTVGITGTSAYTGPASFAYTVTANSEISNSATASLNIISGTIVSWADITGGSAGDGINYDATLSVESPSLASFNGKLYAAWREFGSPSRVHVAVYNGNDGSPSWSFVDTTVGGAPRSSGEGLNHSTSATAQDPKLVVFNSSLYAVWAEGATRNIRIAEYNGNDGSPDWTFRDGDGADGINVNTGNVATSPDAVVYNGELFIAWKESAGAEQIRVKKMNTSYTLTLVDGGGLNYNAARNARSPKMAVLPGSPDKLYIAWHEFDGSFFQARVKVSSNGTSFSAADGGAATGLNHNTGQGAQDMAITAANGEVYLAWLENGANIRVRSYDGSNDASPTWTWRDGGAAGDGIEYGTGTSPVFASAYTHKGDAYINWSEMDGGKFQIRTKSFDGSSWTWHDGGVAASNVNYSTLQDAAYISMATNDNKLYMGWTEDDGTATYQMNVSVGQ